MFKSGYAIDVRCWRSSWKLGENVLLFIPTYIWHCSESLERELESISARLWAGGFGNITRSLHSLAHVCAELADSGLSVVMWYFIFIRVWRRIVLNHIEMITFLFSKRLKQSRIVIGAYQRACPFGLYLWNNRVEHLNSWESCLARRSRYLSHKITLHQFACKPGLIYKPSTALVTRKCFINISPSEM
jgi:hypothetical protein